MRHGAKLLLFRHDSQRHCQMLREPAIHAETGDMLQRLGLLQTKLRGTDPGTELGPKRNLEEPGLNRCTSEKPFDITLMAPTARAGKTSTRTSMIPTATQSAIIRITELQSLTY